MIIMLLSLCGTIVLDQVFFLFTNIYPCLFRGPCYFLTFVEEVLNFGLAVF